MKQTLHALFLSALLLTSDLISAQGKIFIYLNSHNEDNIGYLNLIGGYNNYINTRAALVQLATLTKTRGAKQNWGSDHVALRAIAQYDTGTTIINTSGKNLCRWMSEEMGVECDPHSHESTYNYGDDAYFMNQLGVTPSGNISGFLFGQLQNGNNWEDYEDGIQGDSFPAYTWYPKVLWGGGSPNHLDDLNYYGCYKPKSMAEVNVHDATKHLTLVGTGCTIKCDDTSTIIYNMSVIHRLLDAVDNGTLPANGIYTQEIMMNEGKMKQAYFIPFITQMIDSVNVLVAQGKLQWAHLSEIHDYWKSTYDSVPFIVDCNYNTVIGLPTGITDNRHEILDIRLNPNPTNENLNISVPEELVGEDVSVFDLSGRKILEEKIVQPKIYCQTSNISSGVYFLRIKNEVKKFVKE